jgi:NAD(P)-dependent dehydrogenase (short-subunit alcohol dehydrogenase family)
MTLENRTAIVTGASRGLGRATALRLAHAGARVAVIDIDREGLEEVSSAIVAGGGEASVLVVDITKKTDVEAAVADILSTFGHIDILVNNAGSGWHRPAPFNDTPYEEWEWILDLNLRGTLYVTHAVIGHMVERRYGKIVNIASIAATTGIPNLAVYSASKGALVAFTKSLAMELGPHNINVNCVSPGLIATETVAPPTNGTFLGRKGTAGEMASLIEYMVSDDASFITGADYLIDGGRTLGPRGV